MNPARWRTITEIFEAALERPQAERRQLVEDACAGDSELVFQVRKLLAANEAADSFLERPAIDDLVPRSIVEDDNRLLNIGSLMSDRFQILRFIGQGGMGQVYEAFDLELKTRVALKVIHPSISQDPRALLRFRREVQLTRRITHPNVCRTFDIERFKSPSVNSGQNEITFLTMELLEGETLAELLRRQGRLTAHDALPLVVQMSEALDAAHSVGIIHRDFKPSNIMLVFSKNGTHAVVTDFGLARSLMATGKPLSEQAASSLTGTDGLTGTLSYMAPEQLERGEATIGSDVYSFGLVMFEMVTGRRPFADSFPLAEAVTRLKQRAPSPKELCPDLDAVWDETISRCLETEPKHRFESARAVSQALSKFDHFSEVSPSTANTSASPRAVPHPSGMVRIRRISLAIGTFLVLLSLIAVISRHYLGRRPLVPFEGHDWILVTDFTNSTGEKVFDRVARDLTVESLSQSSYVNVVPRLNVLEAARRMGLSDVNFVDEKLAREICIRENYKALLTGNILKDGSRYVITMKIEAPAKDSATISDSENIQTPGEMFAGVDRLSARIRHALGESLSTIETDSKPLARVTTPSLEALQRYSTALDLYGAREYPRSIALANDAVDRDPNFAMAHLLLGRAYEQLGDEEKSREQLALARSGLDRVGERERHLILAVNYSNQLMKKKAAEEYQHLLDIFPDDVDALKGFAYEAFWAGRSDQAIVAQRRALALSPSDPDCYDTLMTLLIRTNRFGDALGVYDQAKSHNLSSVNLDFLAALAAWGQGDLLRARQTLDSLGADGGSYWKVVSRLFVGKLLAFQGRINEAIAIFRVGLALVEIPGFENWRPTIQYQIARAEIVKADMRSARLEFLRYRKAAEDVPTPINLERGARLALEIGDLQSSKHFQSLARRQVQLHPDSFSQMELHNLTGDVALASGDPDDAIQEQRSALAFRTWYTPLFSLGQACRRRRTGAVQLKPTNNIWISKERFCVTTPERTG